MAKTQVKLLVLLALCSLAITGHARGHGKSPRGHMKGHAEELTHADEASGDVPTDAATTEEPAATPTPSDECPEDFQLRCVGRRCGRGGPLLAGDCSGSFQWGFPQGTATLSFDVDDGMQLCVDQLNNLALRVEGRNSLGNGDCVEGDDGKVTLKASSRGGFLANFYFDQEEVPTEDPPTEGPEPTLPDDPNAQEPTTVTTEPTPTEPATRPPKPTKCPVELSCFGECNRELHAGACNGALRWGFMQRNGKVTIHVDMKREHSLCISRVSRLRLTLNGKRIRDGECVKASGEAALVGTATVSGFVSSFSFEQNPVVERPKYCPPVEGCAHYAPPGNGECCQTCRQTIRVCPGTKCDPIPRCVRYAQRARPGECCLRCLRRRRAPRNRRYRANVCETVRCPTGQICTNRRGKAQCICKKCPKRQPMVPVCGSDGKTYSHICRLHAAQCKFCSHLTLRKRGRC